MDKLPDKVLNIETLRINRNIDKRCKCKQRTFVVDPENRSIYCGICGAMIDPYEAMYELATNCESLYNEVERLLEQGRQIADYKPYLIVFRELESRYRSKKMLPICPRCGEAFRFEKICAWTNRKLEEKRRKKEKKKE